MPEIALVAGSVGAGALCGSSVLIAFGRGTTPQSHQWATVRSYARRSRHIRAALARALERAGWHESPERVVGFALALSASFGVLGATAASTVSYGGAAVACVLGIVAGSMVPLLALRSAIAERRRRLEGELVPLLELFTLELGGGGSAISALGSVTMQVQGELASDLRRLLIASQVAGSASFESRLIDYSEQVQLPAIGSLATILAASREYGTGVIQGVRALAADLRRAQRRELIARSRRALNHVLLPAAVGVLLPFLAILMFPAVSALQHNLR